MRRALGSTRVCEVTANALLAAVVSKKMQLSCGQRHPVTVISVLQQKILFIFTAHCMQREKNKQWAWDLFSQFDLI